MRIFCSVRIGEKKKELIMNSEIGNIKIVRLLIRWFVASPMIINSIARNSQETSNRLGIGGNDWWDELVADDKKMRARERRIGKLNVQHRHQRWVLPLETEQTKRTTRKYEMSNPKIYANCILNVAGLKQCARHWFAVSPGLPSTDACQRVNKYKKKWKQKQIGHRNDENAKRAIEDY